MPRAYLLICLSLFLYGIYNVNGATCSVTASSFETEFCTMKQEIEAVKMFDSRISNTEHEILTLKHTVQTETVELKENQKILQNLQKNISESLAVGNMGGNSTESKLEAVLKILTDLQNRLDHLEVKCTVCGNNASTGHPCDAKPCKNGGKCLELSQDFQCICGAGFAGEECEFRDHCAPSPCQNGGSCTSNILGHVCHCKPGHTGPFCEIQLNECDSNPCKHGRCLLEGTSHKCICDAGYDGPTCENSNGSQVVQTTSGPKQTTTAKLTTQTPMQMTKATTATQKTTPAFPDPCADPSVCNEPSTCKANGAKDFVCICPETDKTRNDKCLTPFYFENFGFCCAKNTCKGGEVVC